MPSLGQILIAIGLLALMIAGIWTFIALGIRDDEDERFNYDDNDYDEDDDDEDEDYDPDDEDAAVADFKAIGHAATELVVPASHTDHLFYVTALDRELRPHLYTDDWYDNVRKDFSAWAARQWQRMEDVA